MTREETSKIVSLLQEVYPGFRSYQSPTAPAAWYIVLEHLTYEQVRTAVIDIIREGQIKPSPADVAKRYPVAVKAAETQSSATEEDYARMKRYIESKRRSPTCEDFERMKTYAEEFGDDT